MTLLQLLAAAEGDPRSQEVTNWGERLGWTAVMVALVAVVYWSMWRAWRRRAARQGDLPELPQPPAEPGPVLLTGTGRYHASTTAGEWLDRIVARGLGTRSLAELTLTPAGLHVGRPAATSFFVPAAALRGAGIGHGVAGRVFPEGGLLVVTWQHGERVLDSGFRMDDSATHEEWADRIARVAAAARPDAADAGALATASPAGPPNHPHDQEGAR
ncbi:PH-like domain-containing protein [Allostreptomyces psammosilenae]|uniref:PH domain-containing protein n=1 Tax=Allostreptomyces psammosilenae TaxID=1892865 RepID=A0A853A391_9ACTN|nr:hypothetical protein [Allostreptomyces psammosilenae]NYI04982.1 hypothetical protein [Allostreptomyces psammosilenae]